MRFTVVAQRPRLWHAVLIGPAVVMAVRGDEGPARFGRQNEPVLTIRGGDEVLATEHSRLQGDTLVGDMAFANRPLRIRTRLEMQKGRPGAYDMQAELPSGEQTAHVEVTADSVRQEIRANGQAMSRAAAVPKGQTLLITQGFVFAALGPQLRAAADSASAPKRDLAVWYVDRAHLETWSVAPLRPDGVALVTASGLRIEVQLRGREVVSYRIPSQNLVATVGANAAK